MNYAQLKQDTLAWQRQLKFAGLYKGKLDGISGKLTREAAAQWDESHKGLRDKFGQVDARSEDNILTLQPLAAMKVRRLIVALRKQGDWKVICGLRTYAEQDALYAKRPRVTKARGGQSMHNFGLAADLCLFRDGEDIWSPDSGTNSIYKPVATAAHEIGLVWGGDWTSIYDPGHVQLGEMSVATLDRAYTSGNYTLTDLIR